MAFSARGAASLLSRIPTALFPISLGLAGFGAALSKASAVMGSTTGVTVGHGFLLAALSVLSVVVLLYCVKLVRAPGDILADLKTATHANLLAPGFMAAMVIGGSFATMHPAAPILWLVATVGHTLLLVGFVARWLTQHYSTDDLNPTWFLPAAGIMTSAMVWPGSDMVGVPTALPMFTLATGALVWLMLLPLVFRKLVFEAPVPADLRPTLFITAAPFGLFAGAVLTLFPSAPNELAAMFLLAGLFIVLVLLFKLGFLLKAGVTLSWWATTFPVATLATGFFRVSEPGEAVYLGIAMLLLALAGLATLVAVIATLRSAWRTCAKTAGKTETEIFAMFGNRK
ncbi:MAG: hypothetical protein JJ850_08770 [Kordiimonadaceae bacterium]|nr:hypothetical protein [Kordiimonadaceae bacterium]MBO6569220.1 hypothetical protein [Kordiimonadaceae bacterium]MBO6964696.1 hypothetical protein [Kordiimonadaceae bacterium]